MPGAVIKITGVDELIKELKKMEDRSSDYFKVQAATYEAAKVIEEAVRARAPQGPTGNLKRGIKTVKLPQKGTLPPASIAKVDYSIAPHAHLLEYGTVRMDKKPFFRPAVDEVKGQAMNTLKSEMTKVIKKAVE
jgi:HK97 gp10 family phage protein